MMVNRWATLAVAVSVPVAALIANPVVEGMSPDPVSVRAAPSQEGPDFDQDCWGPDMMDPDCWGGTTPQPGNWGPGMMGPGMMGPGMMGPWGPGHWNS